MSTTEQKPLGKGPNTIEDIQTDTWSLVQVLDQLAFLLQGISRTEDDREQFQADGLAWCALRMAQKIDRDIDSLVLADLARRRTETTGDCAAGTA